ncbi:MAG TPA: hypothetical protein PKA03_08720 [Tabrizicola sp.]|nr:hypothetical protein [Tabrizicola sp.]
MSEDDDLTFRQHQAANDPAFPARREEAHARIVAALADVLGPEGYVLKGSTWSKPSLRGRSAVHLQRNRYGWDVQIVLRFVTPEGEIPDHPDWPGGDDITLAQFFETVADDPGRLAFLDVLADPAPLDQAVDILREQVLPWFRALHGEE